MHTLTHYSFRFTEPKDNDNSSKIGAEVSNHIIYCAVRKIYKFQNVSKMYLWWNVWSVFKSFFFFFMKNQAIRLCLFMCWTACLSKEYRLLLHTGRVFLLPSASVLRGNGWQRLYKQHGGVMHRRLQKNSFFLFLHYIDLC